ncbi:MAG: hypothetical protein JO295_04050 [Verrucomicrobia bacterium]|nr:hypothetical protein [Verrucomicrobiota bacterium]
MFDFGGSTRSLAQDADRENAKPADSLRWVTPEPVLDDTLRLRAVLAKFTGSGSFRIYTNDRGQVVKAEVVKSVGDAELDAAVVNFAPGHWHGPPNSKAVVPLIFKMDTQTSNSAKKQYAGLFRVHTDAVGNVTRAEVVKSLGNVEMDKAVLKFAPGHWHGRANSSAIVPVTFTSSH